MPYIKNNLSQYHILPFMYICITLAPSQILLTCLQLKPSVEVPTIAIQQNFKQVRSKQTHLLTKPILQVPAHLHCCCCKAAHTSAQVSLKIFAIKGIKIPLNSKQTRINKEHIISS